MRVCVKSIDGFKRAEALTLDVEALEAGRLPRLGWQQRPFLSYGATQLSWFSPQWATETRHVR